MMNPSFKPLNGLYPGSGVAPGGQLGRPIQVHNGLTGAKQGGGTPRASQRRPAPIPKPGGFQPADFQKLINAMLQASNVARPRR